MDMYEYILDTNACIYECSNTYDSTEGYVLRRGYVGKAEPPDGSIYMPLMSSVFPGSCLFLPELYKYMTIQAYACIYMTWWMIHIRHQCKRVDTYGYSTKDGAHI
jgi:hypothetical protein